MNLTSLQTVPHSFGQQLSFFRYTWEQLENEYNCSRQKALQLYRLGLLSFDPADKETLEEFELRELVFLRTLYFDSGLSEDIVNRMLSRLEKPYYYSFSEIVWDCGEQSWEACEAYRDEYPELSSRELVEKLYSEKIRACADPRYRVFMQKIIKRYKSGELI